MAQALNKPMAVGLGNKLKAWWNGDEVSAQTAEQSAGPKSRAEPDEVSYPSPSGVAEWRPQRIASIQRLFGEGIDSPSARPRALALVNPIGLNEEMTVLEIGAGLGAGARAIAKETGAWVDGIESNEALVEEAIRLSAMEGLAKKAVVRPLALDDPEIKAHKRDAVVLRESLHKLQDRERVFKDLCDLLKPSSHLLITDFLTVPGKGRDERAEWSALHRSAPQLYQLDELRDAISKVGFDVRVAKDETKAYKSMLLTAIRDFSETVATKPMPVELQEWIMWEVEYWARTFNALDAGGITLHRLHAVSPVADPTRM